MIADALILFGDVQVGGGTGTIGIIKRGFGNAYRFATHINGETYARIFDEGRLSADRFTLAQEKDAHNIVIDQIKKGLLNTSNGEDANGNMKIQYWREDLAQRRKAWLGNCQGN